MIHEYIHVDLDIISLQNRLCFGVRVLETVRVWEDTEQRCFPCPRLQDCSQLLFIWSDSSCRSGLWDFGSADSMSCPSAFPGWGGAWWGWTGEQLEIRRSGGASVKRYLLRRLIIHLGFSYKKTNKNKIILKNYLWGHEENRQYPNNSSPGLKLPGFRPPNTFQLTNLFSHSNYEWIRGVLV